MHRRRLRELGLLGRRRNHRPDQSGSARLRLALEEFGPLFAGFGRYLGSRADLLPMAACADLAATAIAEQPGAPPLLRGVEIEPLPFKSTLLHRWHRGVLEGGQAVAVKTVRKTRVAEMERQIPDLPVLEELRLEHLDRPGEVVEAYLVWLERQLDLRRELRGLRRLAAEAPAFDAIVVPELYADLSDEVTLVSSDPGGVEVFECCERAGDESANPGRATRLCSAWLQQALLETVLPEGPVDGNFRLLDDGRIAVTGGLFTVLGKQTRRGLLDSLIATSRGDPDRACRHLLAACRQERTGADLERLQVLFRQAEPFRDGGWSESYRGRRLADTLRVQWRLLRREEIELPEPVVASVRGLHLVESAARRLAPDRDCFADAVNDLGVVAAASRLRETLSVRRVRAVAESTVPVLRELAEKADGSWSATEAENGEPEPKPDAASGSWTEIAGLLLLMVAIVIATRGLSAAGIGGERLEPATTALFSAIAAVTLWRMWRLSR